MTRETLEAAPQAAFDGSRRIYEGRGFQHRIGFGRRPALISVDPANAWTRPGYPFTCGGMEDRIMPGMQRLLRACRAQGHAVVHVMTAYQNTSRQDPATDIGLWHSGIPVEVPDRAEEDLWAIDASEP